MREVSGLWESHKTDPHDSSPQRLGVSEGTGTRVPYGPSPTRTLHLTVSTGVWDGPTRGL